MYRRKSRPQHRPESWRMPGLESSHMRYWLRWAGRKRSFSLHSTVSSRRACFSGKVCRRRWRRTTAAGLREVLRALDEHACLLRSCLGFRRGWPFDMDEWGYERGLEPHLLTAQCDGAAGRWSLRSGPLLWLRRAGRAAPSARSGYSITSKVLGSRWDQTGCHKPGQSIKTFVWAFWSSLSVA